MVFIQINLPKLAHPSLTCRRKIVSWLDKLRSIFRVNVFIWRESRKRIMGRGGGETSGRGRAEPITVMCMDENISEPPLFCVPV